MQRELKPWQKIYWVSRNKALKGSLYRVGHAFASKIDRFVIHAVRMLKVIYIRKSSVDLPRRLKPCTRIYSEQLLTMNGSFHLRLFLSLIPSLWLHIDDTHYNRWNSLSHLAIWTHIEHSLENTVFRTAQRNRCAYGTTDCWVLDEVPKQICLS